MKLGEVTSGAVQLLDLRKWQTAWDFDAPGVSQSVRLKRMRYALFQARRRSVAPSARAELDFALKDCESLLAMQALIGEEAVAAGVSHRIARIQRVLTYHEGQVARLNRRYWWVPFAAVVICVVLSSLPGIVGLLEGL
jgi:hypothetical protein